MQDGFCRDLVKGVWSNAGVDAVIVRFSKNWKLARIAKVELTILRLAVYEILHRPDIPLRVALNEAIELSNATVTKLPAISSTASSTPSPRPWTTGSFEPARPCNPAAGPPVPLSAKEPFPMSKYVPEDVEKKMAGHLGGRRPLSTGGRSVQAQVLRPRDVSLPLGPHPYGPCAQLLHRRRGGPGSSAWKAITSCTPWVWGRLRHAGRKCRHQAQAPPRRPGPSTTSTPCASSSSGWVIPTTGAGSSPTCHPDYYVHEQEVLPRIFEARPGSTASSRPRTGARPAARFLANEQVIDGRLLALRPAGGAKGPWNSGLAHHGLRRRTPGRPRQAGGGWPERVLTMQRNWIGRSEGRRTALPLGGAVGGADAITVFTTRPDTVFGATFMSLAAEHPLVPALIAGKKEEAEVTAFVEKVPQYGPHRAHGRKTWTRKASLPEPTVSTRPRDGASPSTWPTSCSWATAPARSCPCRPTTSAISSSPANTSCRSRSSSLPDGDYLGRRPAHGPPTPPGAALPFRPVLPDAERTGQAAHRRLVGGRRPRPAQRQLPFCATGTSRASGYWGAPIPVIYCEKCGIVRCRRRICPSNCRATCPCCRTAGPPLPHTASFLETTCPVCGGKARRETDTLDTFFESSWYFAPLHLGPGNRPAVRAGSRPILAARGPVYRRHRTRHPAPAVLTVFRQGAARLRLPDHRRTVQEPAHPGHGHQGRLQDEQVQGQRGGPGPHGQEVRSRHGAGLRPVRRAAGKGPGMERHRHRRGPARFLARLWRLATEELAGMLSAIPPCATPEAIGLAGLPPLFAELRRREHAMVAKAGADIRERFQFNTAIAAVMEMVNFLYANVEALTATPAGAKAVSSAMASLLTVLSPIAPHICEELWQAMGHDTLLLHQPWPIHDPAALVTEAVEVVVPGQRQAAGQDQRGPGTPTRRPWNRPPWPNPTWPSTWTARRSAR